MDALYCIERDSKHSHSQRTASFTCTVNRHIAVYGTHVSKVCTCAGAMNQMTHNSNQPPGGMYYVNIFVHPFNFSKPEYFIREGNNEADNKTLGVWKLPALGLGDGQYFNIPDEYWLKAGSEIVQVKDVTV
jgi:hypothetical protein